MNENEPKPRRMDAVTLFASVSREDIIHLCIFLAGYQAKLQDLRGACMSMVGEEKAKAWETVIYHWPIIQGTCNQIHLLRIGELEYDPAAVARAVKGAGGPAAELAFQKASDQTLPTTIDHQNNRLDAAAEMAASPAMHLKPKLFPDGTSRFCEPEI